ncbi:MAG: GDP-mannose 4,6-dehydratase [Pseudonocardiaceae bacterium]
MNNEPAKRQSGKTALITGITGQDGSYLAEFLLGIGYCVHGIVRRSSQVSTIFIDHLRADDAYRDRFSLHHGDMADGSRVTAIVDLVQPDEIYHLAAQSDVGRSFEEPVYTGDVAGLGAMRLLEAVRTTRPEARVYQASSSEMFGSAPPPQRENTPFLPQSPYAAAKVYAYWMTRCYRQGYGLFVSNGISFNHESPRRGHDFVTRKIAVAAARIACGQQQQLLLGNLESRRDWGYAPEYVEAMWRILQRDEPGDYVLATGVSRSVRDFLTFCFEQVGLDWRRHVREDSRLLRPTDVSELVGDASKAEQELGWRPTVLAPELAKIMTDAEIERLEAIPATRA